MSGIVGIWNRDQRPIEKAILAKMSATIAHRGPDGEGFWIDGPVGFGCQIMRVTPESINESQPLVHSSGALVVFDGRLDNRDEILSSIGKSIDIDADSPDPAFVLAAYEAFDDRFAEHLNGDFALGLFDPKQQRLIIVRDAIGVRPLYYCNAGKTFLFASEIKAILAHPNVTARPNDEMLAAFLLGDGAQRCHGMTFFNGVSSLIPGHMAIVTRRGFVARQYWDFDPKRRIRFPSFPEYAEAFRAYFEQAVRRRLRSMYPVSVAVSGGLDSSSILCVADILKRRDSERCPPVFGISYTYPDGSPSDEKQFLLEIERDHDVEIERVSRAPFELLNGATEELHRIEAPFLRVPQNSRSMFYDVINRRGARVMLTGTWGDQLLANQEYLIDLFRSLEWRKVWVQLNEFSRWFTDVEPRFFKRSFFSQLVRYHVPDFLRPLLRNIRAKLVGTAPTHALYSHEFQNRARMAASRKTPLKRPFTTAYANSMYQWVRSWYYVQCMEWGDKAASVNRVETAYPFLDRDLISFVLAIPGEIHTWQGVPKVILREAMKGILPEPIRQRRWKADATDLLNEMIEKEYPQLIHCLQSERMALSLGYVNGDVMMKELTRLKNQVHNDTSSQVAWSLGNLIGLELWLQVFFKEIGETKI